MKNILIIILVLAGYTGMGQKIVKFNGREVLSNLFEEETTIKFYESKIVVGEKTYSIKGSEKVYEHNPLFDDQNKIPQDQRELDYIIIESRSKRPNANIIHYDDKPLTIPTNTVSTKIIVNYEFNNINSVSIYYDPTSDYMNYVPYYKYVKHNFNNKVSW